MIPKNYLKARAAIETVVTPKQIRISNEAGVTQLYIYDEIGLWGVSAAGFMESFAPYAGPGDVHVHINSPGGDVYDGLAIYHALKHSEATITVHVDGLAASAASFIAMSGDQIIIGRNARMMVHDASTMTYGNAADHEEVAGWLNEESDNIADIYSQRASGTPASWRETMKAEQWYGSQQAIDAGLADAVEGAEPEATMTKVASSLFRSPDGRTEPVTPKPDDLPDFAAVALALKGAFT
jgi:ATP-dependent protease ClpP protease subunit